MSPKNSPQNKEVLSGKNQNTVEIPEIFGDLKELSDEQISSITKSCEQINADSKMAKLELLTDIINNPNSKLQIEVASRLKSIIQAQ